MRRAAVLLALSLAFLPRSARAEPPSRADRAAAWWLAQRAYPLAEVPAGAYTRGREALRAIRRTPGPPPDPGSGAWQPIGPAPVDTTMGMYETPNMSPSAGRASALVVDPTNPSVLYAGYALGGVWKSIDGGVHWSPLMDLEPTLAVGAIAVDPASPSTIYVGTGEPAPYIGYSGQGILKSTDGGQTFTKIGDKTFDGLAISRLVLDGGTMYAAAFFGALGRGLICDVNYDAPGQGLYKSTDGGATWTLLKDGKITDAEIDTSVTPRRIFISDYATGAFRSDDGGATWAAPAGLPTAQDMPKARRIELSLSAKNPQIVYAGLGLGTAATIFVSQDAGKTFTQMSGAPDYCQAQCYYDNSVLVDPLDENTLYVAGSLCGVWKSTNALDPSPTWVNVSLPNQDCKGGDVWYDGYVHPDVHALTIDAAGAIYASTDGGLARSKDGGDTWSQVNDGVGTLQIYSLCADQNDPVKIYGGSQDNGTFARTSSTSMTWRGIVAGDGATCAIDPENSNRILVSGESASILRTTDGFKTDPIYVFDPDPAVCVMGQPGCGDRVSFIAPLVGDPSTAGTFYVGTYRVFQTTNGGGKWTAISDDLTAGPMSFSCPDAQSFPPRDDTLTAITVAPSSPATIYTGSQAGRIFGTTDGGKTWNRLDKLPLPGRFVTSIAVDPHDPKVVFAAFSGFDVATPDTPGHVFRSADGGQTWTARDIPADMPIDTLLAHPVGSDLLYAGTDAGVLVTTDGGKTWEAYDGGLPHAPVYSLVYHLPEKALIAGTFGRSAWSRASAAPALGAQPAQLDYSFQIGGAAPVPQTISLSNADHYGSIAGFTIAGAAPWLTVDVASGGIAGALPVTVNASVDPGSMAAGKYDTTLTITPGTGAPISIPVHLTITTKTSPMAKSGCGCRSAAPSDGAASAALALVAALGMARRRSRRVSSRS